MKKTILLAVSVLALALGVGVAQGAPEPQTPRCGEPSVVTRLPWGGAK